MSNLSDTCILPNASQYTNSGQWWFDFGQWGTSGEWRHIAINKDGSLIIAVQFGHRIWYSTNGGWNWNETRPAGDADCDWHSVGCDDTGRVILVGDTTGRLWLSKDKTATWVEQRPIDDADHYWIAQAVSGNGLVLIALDHNLRCWMSTNQGTSWAEIQPAGAADRQWYSAACDYDGSHIIIGELNDGAGTGRLFVSTDSGANWNERQPEGDNNRVWKSVDMNVDGTIMFAASQARRLWRSVDSGATFQELNPLAPTAAADKQWYGVACDDTGAIIYACIYGGTCYKTTDSATTWTAQRPNFTTDFYHTAVSANGKCMATVAWGGSMYVSPPQNYDEPLPVVYGDLSDGLTGMWKCPLVGFYFDGNSTAGITHTYCFAGHEVLSVANGNTINVFNDGVLVAPAGYTFDELVDFEGRGNIATITFPTTGSAGYPLTSTITASGKGKPTTTGGSTLITNIVDIAYDFLTVENTFTAATFDSTMKAKTSQLFTSQGYIAAGVVNEDGTYWDIITKMMSSFLGSAYLNGSGLLILDIDDGIVTQTGLPIISKSDITITDVRERLVNIINQVPSNYNYNYSESKFTLTTDLTTHADLASQGIYGVRKPTSPYDFYWCRDVISVQKIQDILVTKFKNPLVEIEFIDNFLQHMELDVGSYFAMTIDFLYDTAGSPLYNQIWKVISVKPDFSKGNITFRALQTPYYMLSGVARDTILY